MILRSVGSASVLTGVCIAHGSVREQVNESVSLFLKRLDREEPTGKIIWCISVFSSAQNITDIQMWQNYYYYFFFPQKKGKKGEKKGSRKCGRIMTAQTGESAEADTLFSYFFK